MRVRVTLLLGLLAAGCIDLSPEQEQEQARIIPGVSVDGVKFGMSWEEVAGLLGEGYGIGAYDAAGESGYILGYYTGPYAGFACYIPSRAKIRPDLGPVTRIDLGESYTGKTKEGIGIGSTTEEVRGAFGPPVSFIEDHGMPESDRYSFTGMSLTFHYAQGKVHSIWAR
jgi:hypothetical protein